MSEVSVTRCNGWLTEQDQGITKVEDLFSNGQNDIQATTAAYVTVMWEYNGTYLSEWFIGDVMSDDALKGGQNTSDMADAYDIENFKTNSNNGLLLQYYRAQYQGIQRCNLAIKEIQNLNIDESMDLELKNRFIGEAKFLRAFFYFRLVRIYGGDPYVTTIIDR